MRIPVLAGRRRARIEIIPLIDIIFFLLATFMVVSLSMVKSRGVAVSLPVAETSTLQQEKMYTNITVTESGELYFDKEQISFFDLTLRLQALKGENPDPKIFVNGDEQAFYGDAIRVLDEVRKQGITKVSIQTRGKASTP